jgi:hypothetical protein
MSIFECITMSLDRLVISYPQEPRECAICVVHLYFLRGLEVVTSRVTCMTGRVLAPTNYGTR